jgi:hypothetical protein
VLKAFKVFKGDKDFKDWVIKEHKVFKVFREDKELKDLRE